jgi:hypothetical protein
MRSRWAGCRGARLIRLGENALFHLPGPNVVVRVARSMAYWEDAGREVAVARWLASQGFPAARAYASVAQPAEAAGRPRTLRGQVSPGSWRPF